MKAFGHEDKLALMNAEGQGDIKVIVITKHEANPRVRPQKKATHTEPDGQVNHHTVVRSESTRHFRSSDNRSLVSLSFTRYKPIPTTGSHV